MQIHTFPVMVHGEKDQTSNSVTPGPGCPKPWEKYVNRIGLFHSVEKKALVAHRSLPDDSTLCRRPG
ncbi:MAG: hypothetical protein DYH02_16345 [Candidatus Omnitrophica bacterium COP1]|nr:hypothetical protein [Candidatus Omnitrophica bacterium COP1]